MRPLLYDLVPIAAMAMLAGLTGPLAGRDTLFALTAAWMAGGLAGYQGNVPLLPAAVVASFPPARA